MTCLCRLPFFLPTFSCMRNSAQALRPALAARLPDIPSYLLPGGFDSIGDIALLTLPHAIHSAAGRIGEAILSLHRHIRVVALRQGNYSGAQRLVRMDVVAGEERLTTLHRENGIALFVDLATVYFSTRLAGERLRLAQQVQAGESVCVLCSGAGPCLLSIARHSQAQEIHGIELNEQAHACAVKNVQINRYEGRVHLHLGEAVNTLRLMPYSFDRMVIALPWNTASLVPAGLAHLRPGGALHCYAMEENGQRSRLLEALHNHCTEINRRVEILRSVRCGHCGPDLYRVCHDVIIH